MMQCLTYEEAVEAAGVIELPDDRKTAPRAAQLPDFLSSRFEDSDAPGVPQ